MKKFLAILFASALLFAGCGDDDSDDASDDATNEDTGSEDPGDGDSGDDGGSDDGSDIDDAGDAAAFLSDEDCNFVLAGSVFNPLAGLQSGDVDQVDDQFQAIAAAAPDEIRDDMALIADRYSDFLELIGDVDLSDPSSLQDPAVQEAFAGAEQFFDDEFEAAGEAVSDYFEENCSG